MQQTPSNEESSAERTACVAEPSSGLSVSEAELVERIRWLIQLRWLAFVGVTATILITSSVFDASLPWNRLLLTALLIPAYNTIFYFSWRRASRAGTERIMRASSRIANAQIACDLVALGVLIHLSGGVENAFGFYFVFHMVIASILLSPRAAYAQATFAVLIFLTVVAGEYFGILQHYNSPVRIGHHGLYTNGIYVFAASWVLISSLYITVYFATSIAARLRWREDQVMLLSERIRRDAGILQVAYDKLAETERAKSAYTRKVTHELRSPLAAIDSLLRTVADGLLGEVSDRARETIVRARNRTKALLATVSDLLTLAAARESPSPFAQSAVDLRFVLENVVSLLGAQAEARKITLSTGVFPDVPQVRGYGDGIEQILINLLSNAIKYSPDGSVVEARITRSGSNVEIEVSDSGIGIEDADKAKIFEEFYRAGNARDFTLEGTGLGLAIVKSIVDVHSGTITIESKPGTGTKFTVSLPIGE